MKLFWETVHGDWCGTLPTEPENILAHVWYEGGWRMSCAFAPDNDDRVIHPSAEDAQEKAQEALEAWVTNHTLGWRKRSGSIRLTGHQLKQALAVVAPDLGDDQLATELDIFYTQQWTDEEGDDHEEGYYVCFSEYPDEGIFGPLKEVPNS